MGARRVRFDRSACAPATRIALPLCKYRGLSPVPERVFDLIQQAWAKLREYGSSLGKQAESLVWLVRILEAVARGKYTAIPWRQVVLAVIAVLYFVMPFDAIPDFTPVVGYADDAAFVAWVVSMLAGDLQAFKKWWESRGDDDEWIECAGNLAILKRPKPFRPGSVALAEPTGGDA